ncbi:MAG: AMP-binding protein [Desulfobacterota bacterium]|jgi:long-chain acyl-CoA synthetase|nr:AMP-binding protein [Thermodesulfobacteriota bacterium]
MNVATNLEASAFYFPQQPALSEAGAEIPYASLNDRVNRMASGLVRMGIRPGDHVGICAPNSTDWIAFYFGVLKTGAVAVTYSSLLSKDELTLLVDHSRPRFIFASEDKLATLEGLRHSAGLERIICPKGDLTLQHLVDKGSGSFKAVDRARTDTAAILYTGGTTGVPKGVMLTHENVNTSAHNVAHNEHSNENDRAICFLPFNHVFGQMHITNATLYSAGCLEILPTFDLDKILALTSSGRVTKMFAVPTIYTRLLSLEGIKQKLGKVRYCFSAAASMAAEIVRQWKDVTGLTIYEGYGMTESASAVTFNHYYRHVVGSIGTAVPGVEVQIRDKTGYRLDQGQKGEICILGHNIMKGYLNHPQATEEAFWPDGWFRSGDIGLFDEEGYLYIVDRVKDMIITGGENVYPKEVEDIIHMRPEVEQCAVVGIPDREWGERVTAFIVPRPGNTVDSGDLKSFLKTRLSPFKVPKEYIVVEEMPKSPAGKILKREIRKQYLESKK